MDTTSSKRVVWVPVLVFLVVAAGLVAIWIPFRRHEIEVLQTRSLTTVEQVAFRLESFISMRLHLVQQMTTEWQGNRINTPERFHDMATTLQAQFGSFQAINWVDPEGIIRWLVPEEANLAAKDRDLRDHPALDDVLSQAAQTGQPMASPPLNLFQGGRGFGAYFPLIRGGRLEGYLNGVFRIRPLVNGCLYKGVHGDFFLRITDEDNELYSERPKEDFDASPLAVEHDLKVLDRVWTITMLPTPALIASVNTAAGDILLVAGLLLAAGLAWTLSLYLKRQMLLGESERRLRLAVENMPVMVVAFDAARHIIVWNRHCEEVTGYSGREIVGNLRAMEILCPGSDHREKLGTAWFAGDGDGQVIEVTVTCRSGVERTISWSNASGQIRIPGWASWGIGSDVTEQRRAEDALRLTQFAMDHAAAPALWVDRDARITYVNEAACRSLGYTRDELVSMTIFDIDPVFPREGWDQEWEKVKQCRTLTFESVHRTRTSEEFPVEISVDYLEYKGREYHFTTARNMSERKRAEQERLRMERQLLQAQKLESLGLLAGGIAHDFNNLLTAMLGSASLARDRIGFDSPVRTHLDHIEAAAQQAADLARQLLAYSGRGRFVVKTVEINALIQEIGHLLKVSVPRQVSLQYELSDCPLHIRADASQIRQIVMNLVVNGAEAIGQRSGTVTVRTNLVEADRAYLESTFAEVDLSEGRYVVVEVSDTGCGMDGETRARIFEPFYSTKARGRGLGLAAVLGILRGHHGAMKVYSELGKGSTFKVLLPSSEAPTEVVAAEEQQVRADPAAGTILVVDDEDSVRTVAKVILEASGYTVLTAADGVESIEVFRQHSGEITAVLLDMTMPRMSGKEAFGEIRKIRPDVPVVLSSGYNEQEATNDFAGHGVAGFIQKPYRADQLLEKIQDVAGS